MPTHSLQEVLMTIPHLAQQWQMQAVPMMVLELSVLAGGRALDSGPA
jgi:hypothetical protein